jgi:hypothetical protein
MRLDRVILGAEATFLFKDTRVVNQDTIALFTGQKAGEVQTTIEGGHEKTFRGIIELAFATRVGLLAGRTWVEQEEEMPAYSLHTIHESYYRDFIGAYARFQINPRLSLLPSLFYSNAPDTSSLTSKRDQEMATQFSLRYRF